jgi:HlyD family secretion protein
MPRRAVIIAIAAAAALAIAVWFAVAPTTYRTEMQGWVEADTLFIGADDPGRLTSLTVSEGQMVSAGALLFTLQEDIQDADMRQASSELAEAEARLARAEAAQQRPEEISVLEAQRTRAKAALEQSKPEIERARTLVEKGVVAQARLDEASAAFERDTAALAEVERQIEVARLRARSEDIDAASQVVQRAAARLASAETRRQQRAVSAPVAGVVQEVYYRTGEVVPSGRPVIALLPPTNIKVRFFVPQSELPHIAYGDRVEVECDGCEKAIAARVSFISSEAEFTPPVIFSREERAKLVFLVEARPEKPGLLRVGQPVTVLQADKDRAEAADAGR